VLRANFLETTTMKCVSRDYHNYCSLSDHSEPPFLGFERLSCEKRIRAAGVIGAI